MCGSASTIDFMLPDSDELTIERAALGRVAIIGDFYDARRDSFVHGNLFNQKLPKECVNIETAASSISDFQFTDTTKDILKVMKLEGELSLSVMTGMFKVGGSAKYLNERKTSSKTMHCLLAQHVQTQVERVNLGSKEIADFIVESAISSETTHVVVGIHRGCNALVDLSCALNENASKSTLARAIEGEITAVGKLGSINGEKKDETKKLLTNVKLRIFADIEPSANLTPITIEDGVKLIREIPLQLQSANKLGVPITYELVAVKEVARILQREIQWGAIFKSLTIRNVEMAKNLLCEAEDQLLRIKEFAEVTERNKMCLPKNQVQGIFKRRDECIISYLETQEKVRGLLSLIRGDHNHTDKLIQLFSDFPTSAVSEQTMDTFFEERDEIVCAVDFLDSLRKRNVNLIERSRDFMQLKRSGYSFVLIFSISDLTDASDEWDNTLEHFYDICEDDNGYGKCAAVVTDMVTKELVSQKIGDGFRIVRIKNQVFESINVVEELKRNKLPPPEPDIPVVPTNKLSKTVSKQTSVSFLNNSTTSSCCSVNFEDNHLMKIFLRCDPKSLLRLSEACYRFNNILSKAEFWEKKFKRDGIALPPLAWRRMKIESPPVGILKYKDVSVCISMSSVGSECTRLFEIDLVNAGIEEWILDNIRPVITVEESFAACHDCQGYYELTAFLLYENEQLSNAWDRNGSRSKSITRTVGIRDGWTKTTFTFEGYGTGIRKIGLKTSGRYREWKSWNGVYDIKFANTRVTVEFPKQTSIAQNEPRNKKCCIS